MALRKMLKKYDKIHRSKQGQAFKMQIQIMHIEILRSPWLCELLAFYLNNSNNNSPIGNDIHGLLKDMSLTFDEGSNKPSLTCGFFDSFSINVDLTCSICLDTVFDPISLACGHIFCYICACGAASETIIDGLREASSESKCPLCRQEGVYRDYVRLTELNILLRENCHAYWEKRLQSERMDRLQQAKEYWDAQCRNIIGI
ncbi:E3 ubiquitin-protein ligase BAH1 [Zostera marina]|uniref:E3 ubiquitin-protein ligase BAH1 n=1 Tax=Zostera marina TaxID=29655 RepID=A0A0K9PDY0_ZOSMR|nr:E3 ubiquitin-protein ligase BAH1 [Zostera marina]